MRRLRLWLRRRPTRGSDGCGIGARLFSRRNDPGNRLPYWNVCSFGCFDSRQDAVGRRFHFDDCFVSFYFEEGLALGDAVAFLLAPGNELAGFLRHLESGHYYAEGHNRSIGEGLDDGLQPL